MIKLLTHSNNRSFQRLWLAQLISQFGDRITQLALIGLVSEKMSGSAMDLAKVMMFTILPVFLVQPFAGVFVDRWDRRTTLFVCDLCRGLLVLMIPLYLMNLNSIWPIYGIVFLTFCFSRFYLPAKMSILPDIVDRDSLLMANSLVSTTGMIAFVVGCSLGGFLIDQCGARNGFIIDAGTFFISAVLVFSLRKHVSLKTAKERFQEARKEFSVKRKSVWAEFKEGIDYLYKHEEFRFVLWMLFMLLTASGAVYVVIIVFIQEAFGSITKDLGILAVCLGAGFFLGALAYGKWGKRFHWAKTIFFTMVSAGLMLITFACIVYYNPSLIVAMFLAVCLGIVIGPIFIATNALMQVLSDDHMRGKVFSTLEIVIHLAFMISMLISSWLAGFVPRVWILCGVGIMAVLVGGIGWLKLNVSRIKLREL